MLVSSKDLLMEADKERYAIAAFNFYNLDTLMAIIEAAEAERAPIIAQIYSDHFVYYNNGGSIAKAALQLIDEVKIPVCLHLDHCTSAERIRYAIELGFTSVMYDGSALPLDENIAQSTALVAAAHEKGVYTEVELGRLGRISDDTEELCNDCTRVEDALRLISASGADSFAPAIGNAHGIYRTTPNLNIERIVQLRQAVGVPLVLHGGSGIPDELIRCSIRSGIAKINVGTELKYQWAATMKQGLDSGIKEPIRLGKAAKDTMREIARRKIRLFGSNDKV